MGARASQITSPTIVFSTAYSDADQRKHQSPASLVFVRGIHRLPVNSPHKWPATRKIFPFHDVMYWPFVWGIHWSPVNPPNKDQWRGALMFSLICDWIKGWVNNRKTGDLRRHRIHYDVSVMKSQMSSCHHATRSDGNIQTHVAVFEIKRIYFSCITKMLV